MKLKKEHRFWRDAVALQGSITPQVVPYVLTVGVIAIVIRMVAYFIQDRFGFRLGLQVAPYEIAGAVLGLLLILRTNAGYDRWWEARKLWGGIVNQSRNFAITALTYGPADPRWRDGIMRWTSAFPHVARCSLRGEPVSSEVSALVGREAAGAIEAASHMPSFVAMALGQLLREACEKGEMDRFAFLQADRERALLIDHIGGCERILKTPLPRVYAIKIRRFIVIFLVTLPLALLDRLQHPLLVPLISMMVAYPIISLDQIGIELQNPFSKHNLSHLPLDDISSAIERNVMGFAKARDLVAAEFRTAAIEDQQTH